MSVVDEIVIRMRAIGGKSAAGEIGAAEQGIGRLGKVARTAAGVAGLGALAFGIKDISESAIKWQAQQAQLANSLKNAGQYSAENVKRMTEAADALATHGGFDPAKNLLGMQRLVDATHNVGRAISDEQLVTDLARKTHLNYEPVLKAIINLENGRTTGLTRLGLKQVTITAAVDKLRESHQKLTPEMLKTAKEQDKAASRAATFAHLWGMARGATDAYSKTAAGAASNFKNAVEILGQKLGTFLLPIITKVLHVLTGMADWLIKNKTAMYVVLGVIGAIAAGFTAVAVAAAAAFVEENAALLGIPALIALVVAGIVMLVKHWKEVKKFMGDHAWIQALLAVFMPIVGIPMLIALHFKEIKRVAIDVFNAIKGPALAVFGVLKTLATGGLGVLKTGFLVIKTVALFLFNNVLKPQFMGLKTLAVGAFQIIRPVAVGVFNAIKGIATVVFTVLRVGFTFVKTIALLAAYAIKAVWENVVAPVFNSVIKPAVNAVKDAFMFLWNNVLKPVGSFLSGVFKSAWTVLQDVFTTIKPIIQAVADAIGKVLSTFKDIGNWVAGAGQTVINFMNDLNPFSSPKVAGVIDARMGNTAGLSPHAYGGTQRRAGWSTVGEHGIERVFLPGGATVAPNEGAGQTPGGGPPMMENHMTLQVGPRDLMKVIGYSQAKLKATS